MMGAQGLRNASAIAVLNANYMAARLAPYFPVTYKYRLAALSLVATARTPTLLANRSGLPTARLLTSLLLAWHPSRMWVTIGIAPLEPDEGS
jgi:hypothetical protein